MRARRVDANHARIVKAFRQMGCNVLDLSRVGQGCPDLLIAKHGINVLVEIKDGSKPPSARKLTPDEQQFHADWKGRVATVLDVEDAALDHSTLGLNASKPLNFVL